MGSELTKIENPINDPETWMDQYGDLLYRFALVRVQDFAAAEDLVQETFLAALGAYKNFKGHSTLRTWLIAILKNKSVDHIRKKVKERGGDEIDRPGNGIGDNFNGQGDWPLRHCKWFDTPLKLYADKELMDTLSGCLSGLPGRLAQAFIMREIDGLSTKEICEALNITPTNCWVMFHRARRRLRACIETHLPD
jgi:RNA polymerase sigma-70 factor (TIGR02943 family)